MPIDKNINECVEEFGFKVEQTVLGRTIIGVKVESGSVSVHLSDGGVLAFRTEGKDIVINLPEVAPAETQNISAMVN